MSIEVSGLLKKYGQQKAINEISFAIKKGEIVGFLGPNGAGKSTTMKSITGYLQPDAGFIKVCGIDVSTSVLQSKKKIGYLPESNPLYTDMYIKEYLAFIAGVHSIGNIQKAVKTMIELTGLEVEQKKKIGQLSKGYKQRVGLAAALIHEPEVLILDEPTTGLDPNQIIEIRNLIIEQGKNKTVLFSSHILQEVTAICNRVIIISKGNIVVDDTIQNLQNKKQHKDIVSVKFKETLNENTFNTMIDYSRIEYSQDGFWLVEGDSSELIRKQLLQMAVQKNLNIVSLQTQGNNLEDIFKQVTVNQG